MVTPLGISHFRAPPRPPLSSLPGVAKLLSCMAEAMAKGLSGIRSAPWRITPEGLTQDEALSDDGDARVLRLESELGSVTLLLSLDRQTVSALLDTAMGGTGAEAAFEMNTRPLSRIESALVELARTTIGQHLAAALSEFTGRPFSLLEGGEVPELDKGSSLAQLCYVSNLYTYSGEIRLVVSRVELEKQLLANLASPAAEADIVSVGRQSLQDEVAKAEVTLTVTLQPEILSVDVLAGMQPGRMIELSATARTPVAIWSGGVAAFHGNLGRSNDRYAVTILTSVS